MEIYKKLLDSIKYKLSINKKKNLSIILKDIFKQKQKKFIFY